MKESNNSGVLYRFFETSADAKAFYMSNRNSALMRAVRDVFYDRYDNGKKIPGVRDHFYRNHYTNGETLFFYARDWHSSVPEVVGTLDKRERLPQLAAHLHSTISESMERKIRAKDGGFTSPLALFMKLFRNRYGLWTDEQVTEAFCAFIAYLFRGLVFERLAFDRLRAVFGVDAVEWATNAMEKNDIDVFVSGVPVSVKCGQAWNRKTLDEYGQKVAAYSIHPAIYVNEKMEWSVRTSTGYRSGTRENLPAAITKLSSIAAQQPLAA